MLLKYFLKFFKLLRVLLGKVVGLVRVAVDVEEHQRRVVLQSVVIGSDHHVVFESDAALTAPAALTQHEVRT